VHAVSPDDFAYESRLSDSQEALQSVDVPLEVLLDLTRADLGDMVIFDNAGKTLPSWIRPIPQERKTQRVELKFHNFNAYLDTRSKTVTRRENNSTQETFPQVETTEVLPVQQARQDYIIELDEDQLKLGINQVELDWSHEPANQILKLRVEVANDLDNWSTLHATKNLSSKISDKQEWRLIENIPRGKKYIRLIPLNSIQSFQLKRVEGLYQPPVNTDYLWHSAGVLEQSASDPDYYAFNVASRVHPQLLKLIPQNGQQLLSGDLYASHDDFENARKVRSSIQQHNFTSHDQLTESEPISMGRTAYRQWWFKPDKPLTSPVAVELGYLPYENLFLANNNGPYKLAWGNVEAMAPDNELIGLLTRQQKAQNNRGAKVQLGDVETRGGPSRLEVKAEVPWLKWLLWSFLLLAVLLTGRMAMSLYRDMKTA